MFIKKKYLGIDISDYSVEVVCLVKDFPKPRILGLARTMLWPGIFKNGRLVEKKQFQKILKDLLKNPDMGKMEASTAIISIPEQESFILNCSFPATEKKDKANAYIAAKVKESFPYLLDELVYDHQFLNGNVFIAAVPKGIVSDYVNAIKSCRIKPIAIETESVSLNRALLKTDKTVLAVDIGANVSSFIVFNKGKLQQSFSAPIGGNNFTKALSIKLNISDKKAEDLKQKFGLDPEPEEGRVFLILQKEVNQIILEIKKIEDYFAEEFSQSIEKIIIFGGSSFLPFLAHYLSENLQKPVEILDPLEKVDASILKRIEHARNARKLNPVIYTTAIGLALRGFEKNPKRSAINLLSSR
ncbi:MAG: pilus assembly protein PilM [bacterium]